MVMARPIARRSSTRRMADRAERAYGYAVPTSGTMQPWNHVVFPSVDSNWEIAQGMTARRAKAIPAVGRAVSLIAGMALQMPLDDVRMRDEVKLDRPRLLDQPDPEVSRAWWVGMQVEDYLLHGNAVQYITSRDPFSGYPLTVAWVPACWVTVAREPATELGPSRTSYWVGGRELDPHNVVHVRRGADDSFPWRGVGVVEQYLQPLNRVAAQEAYESQVLNGSAVPSVAIITPNPELDQDEADQAKDDWMEKFSGPVRKPAILPAGTQVIPLAWSPHDTQLQEARKAGLLDVANMFNLDGYWLGAPAGSFTYRSPGPMYLNLVRQTVAPILEPFEQEWSAAWLPRGRKVRFDRRVVLLDDMATNVRTVKVALDAQIITQSEARQYLGWSADVPPELVRPTVPGPPATTTPPDNQLDNGEDQT